MISLKNINIAQFDPSYVLVSWRIDSTRESLSNYTIYIQRSEGVTDFTTVTGLSAAGAPNFQDDVISGMTSKFLNFSYIVAASGIDGSYHQWPPYQVRVESDSEVRYIIKYRERILNRFSGNDFLVLVKKTFGQFCPTCYDVTLQDTMQSHCATCYDTKFVGGYYSPYKIRAQINEAPSRQQITVWGDWQDQDAVLTMSNYPLIRPDDIIVDKLGRRWVTQATRSNNKSMYTFSQSVQMRMVDRDSIIYIYPITF